MKVFEAFEEFQKELLFIQLIHLDELEIKFDFINIENIFRIDESIYYFYKDNCIFSYHKNHNNLSVEDDIWSDLSTLHSEKNDVKTFIKKMISKYININNCEVTYRVKYVNDIINKNFAI